MLSGAINAVNWDVEPLPHEVNFVIQAKWTPSNTLKHKQQQDSAQSPERGSGVRKWFGRSSSSPDIIEVASNVPLGKNHQKMNKVLIFLWHINFFNIINFEKSL